MSGKVAIITGGAGDIGKAAALRFAAEGARVLLVDLEHAALKTVCKDLDCENVRHFTADVTSTRDNAAMVTEAIRCFGGVDILLAKAGTEWAVRPIVDCDEALFDRVMVVNVKGPFLGMRAVIPAMAARGGGSIVITSSVAGIHGSAQVDPYSTSKHAVIGLMKSAAKEVAAQNIGVNTVNPGPVASRMISGLEEGLAPGAAERAKSVIQSNIPIGRYATSEEIANVMLFLASDEAACVTGAVYLADGGMMA